VPPRAIAATSKHKVSKRFMASPFGRTRSRAAVL